MHRLSLALNLCLQPPNLGVSLAGHGEQLVYAGVDRTGVERLRLRHRRLGPAIQELVEHGDRTGALLAQLDQLGLERRKLHLGPQDVLLCA